MRNKKSEKSKRDAKTWHEEKNKSLKKSTSVDPEDRDDEGEYREEEFTYRSDDDENEYY